MPPRDTFVAVGRQMTFAAGTLLLVACMGCGDSGPKLGDVQGVVTIDGKPLTDAEVEFFPFDKGKSSIGFTNENGEYRLQYSLSKTGALLGKHKVTVRVNPPPGTPAVSPPPGYGSGAQLEYEVTPGANTYDIEIESAD